MCKTCQMICDEIEEIFGHKVDPHQLEELIETSPLTNNNNQQPKNNNYQPNKQQTDREKNKTREEK